MGAPTADAIELLLDVGLAALLIVGGYLEWYVWGPAHRRRLAEKSEEARFWRDMALRGTRLAETAVDAAVGGPDRQAGERGGIIDMGRHEPTG